MKLSKVISGLTILNNFDYLDVEISGISFSSRENVEGSIFVCLKGENTDGHIFAKEALNKGARYVVCEKDLGLKEQILVPSTRQAFSIMAANLFSNPQKRLKMIAITGTNGKTTTTHMLKSILKESGKKVGLIGTEGAYVHNQYIKVNLTTPDPLDLFKIMDTMVKNDCEYCIMEASAHSLYFDKLYAINFDIAMFSNFTQDHLDFFKTMENYKQAKLKLFSQAKLAILNFDDAVGIEISKKFNLPFISYGLENPSDSFAIDIVKSYFGSKFVINLMDNVFDCEINIPGRYNIYNALCAVSAAAALGIDKKFIVKGLKNLLSVSGRFNTQTLKSGAFAVIDFAHTPDGIENVLLAIKDLEPKRIITVFGCAGNRDETKRPQMGEIAEKYSDFVILTSDNPRFENPSLILNDIERGMKLDKHIKIEDRKQALKLALNLAREGDIVAILGKGAETYQDINGVKSPYNDSQTVNDIDNFREKIKNKMEGVN